jgi:hypothetical protein
MFGQSQSIASEHRSNTSVWRLWIGAFWLLYLYFHADLRVTGTHSKELSAIATPATNHLGDDAQNQLQRH